MTEKDIVDFSKLSKDKAGDYIDNNGKIIECEVCHLHEQAYKKLTEDRLISIPIPHCPTCGEPMEPHSQSDHNDSAIVGETNFYTEDGNIGYYPVFYCKKCNTTYALMSTAITYHGGHNIFYTGGRHYVYNKEQEKLVESITSKCMEDVEQYLSRKENPKDDSDRGLKPFNLKMWLGYSIEEKIASWLYEQGLKK